MTTLSSAAAGTAEAAGGLGWGQQEVVDAAPQQPAQGTDKERHLSNTLHTQALVPKLRRSRLFAFLFLQKPDRSDLQKSRQALSKDLWVIFFLPISCHAAALPGLNVALGGLKDDAECSA